MNTLPANVVHFPVSAVMLKDGHPITTSRAIAEVFGKEHKNVLRAIENLDCPGEFIRLNFEPADYIDKNGDRQPMYELTKDGMVYLVMGFTGPKAARFKVAYIEAFNALEAGAYASQAEIRKALLAANPVWDTIRRCAEGRLTNRELARLLGIGETTVRSHKAKMRACGLLGAGSEASHG
jgi:Rha family phage regulatory protein